VMKAGSDPNVGDEVPVDGSDATSYSPNSVWGSAGTIGAGGARVVFMGTGNSVNVTDLAPSTTYYVRIYEYAGTGTGVTGINYLEGSPLSGNSPTSSLSVPLLITPVLNGALTAVTSTIASLGATQTDTGGATVTARGIAWNTTGTPVKADNFTELETGGPFANEAFFGNVPSLTAGTRIYFRGYATNSEGDGYTGTDGTVYTEPSSQPTTGLGFTPATTSMTIVWDDPAGVTIDQGTIIVMKAGSDPTEVPADGSDASVYSPSNAWGSAGAIGTAKVVFMGTGNSVNVTGLIADTFYHVRI